MEPDSDESAMNFGSVTAQMSLAALGYSEQEPPRFTPTAFRWVEASWDNAEAKLLRGDQGGRWRGPGRGAV